MGSLTRANLRRCARYFKAWLQTTKYAPSLISPLHQWYQKNRYRNMLFEAQQSVANTQGLLFNCCVNALVCGILSYDIASKMPVYYYLL